LAPLTIKRAKLIGFRAYKLSIPAGQGIGLDLRAYFIIIEPSTGTPTAIR
jgi:hypothetical protein